MEEKRDLSMNELTDDMLDEVSGGWEETVKNSTELDLGKCRKCSRNEWDVTEAPYLSGTMITVRCRKCGYTYTVMRWDWN